MTVSNRLCLAALLGVVACCLNGEGAAQDKKAPNEMAEKKTGVTTTKQADYVANLSLATGLVRFGRQNEAPDALLTAAKIIASVPTLKRSEKPTIEKTGNDDKAPVLREDSPAALVAEARKMAYGNPVVVALADQVDKEIDEVARGAVRGPLKSTEIIGPLGVQSFRITFRGGEFARVIMDGDGGTDLDIFIYDEFGNLVRSDVGLTDFADLSWVPRFTGPFTIRIVNLGPRSNRYVLINN